MSISSSIDIITRWMLQYKEFNVTITEMIVT